jgi:membrane associated rhomboid family serine protease
VDPLSAVAIGVIAASAAYALARKALLSLAFGIALLIVYAIQIVAVAAATGTVFVLLSPVTRDLGLSTPFGSSGPWSWITFQFVHGSESHLLFNLMALVFICPVVEERIGTPAWAVLFFAGGAFGALVFGLVQPGRVLLVGASAGLLAVFGSLGRLYPRERIRLFLPLPGIPSLPALTVVLGFLVLELVLSLVGPSGIAWEAHVAGIAFGFAVAPVLRRLPARKAKAARPLSPTALEALRPLAASRELREVLAEIERADLPELRDAWVEKLIRAAPCPRCGGPLRLRWGRITSPCGWTSRLS